MKTPLSRWDHCFAQAISPVSFSDLSGSGDAFLQLPSFAFRNEYVLFRLLRCYMQHLTESKLSALQN